MNKRALFAALALLPLFAQAEIKTIKDVLGREVKVDVPVKRAVLAFYYPDYIAVTGADKFKNVIGISCEFWEKFNPGSWAMFKQKLPTLQNIADIGNISTGTFSLEKTLALKPNVLDENSLFKKAKFAYYKAYHDQKQRWSDGKDEAAFLKTGLDVAGVSEANYQKKLEDPKIAKLLKK